MQKNTVEKFYELNSKSEDLIAVVGPCIKKENYAVKKDFIEKFTSQNKKNKSFFEKINNEHHIFFHMRCAWRIGLFDVGAGQGEFDEAVGGKTLQQYVAGMDP